jgi:membrane fusion protein, multidrug efflux system
MSLAIGYRSALIAVAAAGALAVAGCGSGDKTSGNASTRASGLATLEVGAENAPAETLLDGVVEAVNQATLSAQTAGRVAEVLVDVNDTVRKDELLCRLRATEQVAGLGQAQAALQAATARDAQASAQFDRIRDMYERKVVARATYDEAVTARDAAAANLAAARAALESAREGVAYTEVRAPYDGVVTARRVQPGEAVAPGMPLLTVSALGTVRVVAEIPQSMADQVRSLRQARVYAGGESIASSAVTMFPAADPQSGTFRVRVDLPATSAPLAPGMHAKVGFATGEASRTLVPRSAVVERSELRAVYVVTPDGHVVLRQVRLGRPFGDDIEVIAGLARGERVAVDPAAAGVEARSVAASTHE